MKRTAYALVWLLVITLSSLPRADAGNDCKENNTIIIDGNYFPVVKGHTDAAVTSIQVMMFEASYYRKLPISPTNRLIKDIITSHKRGVGVEVILERGTHNERTTARNLETCKLLQENGFDGMFYTLQNI